MISYIRRQDIFLKFRQRLTQPVCHSHSGEGGHTIAAIVIIGSRQFPSLSIMIAHSP